MGGCQAAVAALENNFVAETFPDSVGVGSYRIDLYSLHGRRELHRHQFSALSDPAGDSIPRQIENLLPACKNLGTTHITNGCFRLHPVEWAIGEAAGAPARRISAWNPGSAQPPYATRPVNLRPFSHD